MIGGDPIGVNAMGRRGDGGRWRPFGIGVVLGLVLLIGCTRSQESPSAAPDPGDTTATSAGSSTTGSGSADTVPSPGSDDDADDGAATDPDTGSDGETGGDTDGGDAGEPGDGVSSKVLRFVYFVEAGETMRPEVREAIEDHAVDLQRYWYQQFGGTFQLADPVVTVIEGDNDAAWYDTTPDGIHDDPRWYRLGNISTEVRSKLGTVDTRFVTYPATTVAEPRVGVNFGGAWMDGDDALCILGETASFPYPDGNDAHCLGHVAHELGHVYGLAHVGPLDDCMQFGFYDAETMCRFSAENREAVRNDPANVGWLDLELDLPLDPDPEPAPDAGQEPVTGPVDIIVENTGCRSVELLWVEAEDQLRSYGTIAPGASFRQSTFVGHGWTVEVDGEEINRFVVTGPDTIRTDSGGC